MKTLRIGMLVAILMLSVTVSAISFTAPLPPPPPVVGVAVTPPEVPDVQLEVGAVGPAVSANVFYDGPFLIGGIPLFYFGGGFFNFEGGVYHFHHMCLPEERGFYHDRWGNGFRDHQERWGREHDRDRREGHRDVRHDRGHELGHGRDGHDRRGEHRDVRHDRGNDRHDRADRRDIHHDRHEPTRKGGMPPRHDPRPEKK